MSHTQTERTLVIIKPDGIQRSLIGEIVTRFERSGLKMSGMKMMVPDHNLIEKHYSIDPDWIRMVGEKSITSAHKRGHAPVSSDPIAVGQFVLKSLKKYLTSGPVVAMVWQGPHAVEIVRKLVGSTEPLSSDVGTIRGDFVVDSYQLANTGNRAVRNLVHASGAVHEAEKEIPHWFKTDEIVTYTHINEKILSDVNVDGIVE